MDGEKGGMLPDAERVAASKLDMLDFMAPPPLDDGGKAAPAPAAQPWNMWGRGSRRPRWYMQDIGRQSQRKRHTRAKERKNTVWSNRVKSRAPRVSPG